MKTTHKTRLLAWLSSLQWPDLDTAMFGSFLSETSQMTYMQLAMLVGKFSVTTGRQPVISEPITEFTSLPAALQEQLL